MKSFAISLLAIVTSVMLVACYKIEITNKGTEKTTDYSVKEENEQSKGETPGSGTLSDDIYSFQLEINGDVY